MSVPYRQDGNDVDTMPHHAHLTSRLPTRLSPRSSHSHSHRPSTAEEPLSSSSGWQASSSAIRATKREDADEDEEDGRVKDRRASPVPRSHLHPSLSHPSLSRTDNAFTQPQSRHSASHSRRAHPYPRPRDRDRQRRSDSRSNRSNHSSQSDSYARLSVSESSFSGDELEFDELDNQDSDWRAESESLLHPHSSYPSHHPQPLQSYPTGRDSRNRDRKVDVNSIHPLGRTQSLHSLRSGRSGYSNYTNYPVHSPPPPSQLSSPYLDSSSSGPDRGRMRTHPRQSNMDERDMNVDGDVDVDMDELNPSDEEYDKRRQSVQSVQSLRSIGGISAVSTDDGSYGGESASPPPMSSPHFTFVTHAHSTPSSHSSQSHGSDAGSHRGSYYGGNSHGHAGTGAGSSSNPRAGEGSSPSGSGNGSATAPLSLDSLPSYPADQKPPFSYPVLIRLAILGSPQKRLLLSQIYSAIEEKFPWYRDSAPKAWKASVRHCLSLNKEFVRMQRAVEDPGVGCGGWWSVGEGMKGLKRPRKRRPPHAKREDQERSVIEQQQYAMSMGMPHGSPLIDVKVKANQDYPYDMEAQSPGGAAIRRRHTVQVRTDPYPVFIAPAPAAGSGVGSSSSSSSSGAMMGMGVVGGPSSASAPGSAVASGFGLPHSTRGVERESPYLAHREPMYPPRIPSPQYQGHPESRHSHSYERERRSEYASGGRERERERHPRYHHAPHSSSDSSVGAALAREFRDQSLSSNNNIDYSLRLPPLQIPNMDHQSSSGPPSAHSGSQSRSQLPNSSNGSEKRSNLMSISSLISGSSGVNPSPSPPSSSLSANTVTNSGLNAGSTPTWRTANLKTDPLSLLASASVGDLDLEMYARERQQAQQYQPQSQYQSQYQYQHHQSQSQPQSQRQSLEGDRSSGSADANTSGKKRRERKPKEEDMTPFSSEQTIRPMSTPTPSPPASPVTSRNSRDGLGVAPTSAGVGVGMMEGRDVDIRSRRSRMDVESESE